MKTEDTTESMNTEELNYKENKKYRFKKQRQRNWRKKLKKSQKWKGKIKENKKHKMNQDYEDKK